ncbi:hypothetical protein A3E49_02820 [Candidatus Saccharibacteria bacterium RIFCSPHIGHO2_12_FULL_49_19]|nr:MAG: hypothetical protein A2708_01510 [Candidatus Saccharibacteria bacterium RIFCSPHIGHO2_01_FULL_49_21]OGL37263.1 MAG: hypothetical protein A3E49_02820 [Candidatus Saccharibacteria bacterium RIFCSPHIGHO2_12_FULL_49_19]OGL37739.1 MAG: hypothetical protein A3B63_00090 [Candidatus Saccharibacteria bacterium RIFCSPLOWO2_01_FULL_49_22]
MLAVLFAAFAHIGYGVGDVYGTFATRKLGPFIASFWITFFGVLLSAFGLVVFRDNLSDLDLNTVAVNTGLAVLLSLSYLSFLQALKIGNAPLVGTISGSFPAVSVIVAVIFFNERPSSIQVATMLVIFIGIILSSLDIGDLRKQKTHLDRVILLSLFTMLGWGIYFSVIRIPIEQYGWYLSHYIAIIVSAIIYYLLLLWKREPAIRGLLGKKGLKDTLSTSILVNGGTFSFNYALSIGSTSVVVPIAGSYPALFAFLSFKIFKEKLTSQQIVGIVLTLVGVIALAVASA